VGGTGGEGEHGAGRFVKKMISTGRLLFRICPATATPSSFGMSRSRTPT
jgi:hypothetical protein